jgi:deazaflavin-dependent oxidoreductase (nitroreductase family)
MPEMNDFNKAIIDEFRANHGKVGGGFEGAPVILLTTTGARTGEHRVNPLVSQPKDHDTIYVFGSAGGGPRHPDWYYNLVAHPRVEVEFGDDTFSATATVLSGPKRDEIYARQVELFPGFGDYERATTRTIPVVTLTRYEAE